MSVAKSQPVDTVWLSLFLTSLLVSSQSALAIVGLPLLHSEGGMISSHQLGILLGVVPIATAITALVTGPLSDFFGRKRLIIFGQTAFGIASGAHFLAGDFVTLFILRALVGAASGILLGLPSTYLSDHLESEKQTPSISRSLSGYAFGHAFFIPVGVLFIDASGFLFFTSLVGLACSLVIPMSLKFLPADRSVVAISKFRLQLYSELTVSTLGRRTIGILSLVSMLGFFATSFFYIILVIKKKKNMQLETAQIAPMYLMSGIVQTFVMCYWIPKLDKSLSVDLVVISFLSNGILMLTFLFGFQYVWSTFILSSVVMGSVAFRIAPYHHIIANVGEAQLKGLRMSISQTSSHIGRATGIALGTMLFHKWSSVYIIMIPAGILLVCALILTSAKHRINCEQNLPGSEEEQLSRATAKQAIAENLPRIGDNSITPQSLSST